MRPRQHSNSCILSPRPPPKKNIKKNMNVHPCANTQINIGIKYVRVQSCNSQLQLQTHSDSKTSKCASVIITNHFYYCGFHTYQLWWHTCMSVCLNWKLCSQNNKLLIVQLSVTQSCIYKSSTNSCGLADFS